MMRSSLSVFSLFMVFSLSAGASPVSINGKPISDLDLKAILGTMNEAQKHQILKNTGMFNELLDTIRDEEVLYQAALKENLDKDSVYQVALQKFKRQFLSSRFLDKKIGTKMTDVNLQAYFKRNRARYSLNRVQVAQIVVADLATAEKVKTLAQKPGANFGTLAEQYSIDPQKNINRGELGMVGWDSPFKDEFKTAALQSKSGSIAGPVQTSFGYHIIKVGNHETGRFLEFAEVEPQVRADYRKELVEDEITSEKRGKKIAVDPSALRKALQ